LVFGFSELPTRATGRSDAAAAGWGLSVVLGIETQSEANCPSGPDGPTLPKAKGRVRMFVNKPRNNAQKLYDSRRESVDVKLTGLLSCRPSFCLEIATLVGPITEWLIGRGTAPAECEGGFIRIERKGVAFAV